jgi:hypothetical protein
MENVQKPSNSVPYRSGSLKRVARELKSISLLQWKYRRSDGVKIV